MTPSCATTLRDGATDDGRMNAPAEGQSAPRTDGPRTTPAITSPITGGCPIAANTRPSRRPVTITAVSAMSRGRTPASAGLSVTSGPAALREHQLVDLVRSVILRRAGEPRRNRLLTWRIERLHRLPHRVHLVLEQVADQQIGDGAPQVRIVLHERAKAETVVVLAHQAAHAIDALVETVAPLPELRAGGVALRETFDDRIRRKLS